MPQFMLLLFFYHNKTVLIKKPTFPQLTSDLGVKPRASFHGLCGLRVWGPGTPLLHEASLSLPTNRTDLPSPCGQPFAWAAPGLSSTVSSPPAPPRTTRLRWPLCALGKLLHVALSSHDDPNLSTSFPGLRLFWPGRADRDSAVCS